MCDANQYDIIHFEGLFVAQYLPLIKTKSVKILRQHNIEYSIWKTLAATKKGLKAWYINFLAKRLEIFEKDITKQFDALVSITEADRITSIQTLNFTKVSATIPAGIRMNISAVATVKSSKLYHIGSMEWMPNMEAMEWFHKDIWPLIAKASPEAEFFMAGKNMPSSYQTWNDNHFHVSGEVESVENFSTDKGILLVPLRSGSGIRIKTIEAMMAGKAVVTTSQGAQGLDIIDGEHCLIADDAKTFAEKTIMLIKDETLRQKLSENGKLYAESNFGNEAVSEIWLRFYRDILAMNHG